MFGYKCAAIGLLLGTCLRAEAPAVIAQTVDNQIKASSFGVSKEEQELPIPVCDGFDFPVGKTPTPTAKKDGDGWYNAQGFHNGSLHLGDDWNAESGGNTDCGKPVYAAALGRVVFSGDAGMGWGNVIIVRHRLPDGRLMETLYGHLRDCSKKQGELVKRREQLGTIGDGENPCGDSEPYWAHLHFELRHAHCPDWGSSGGGYSYDTTGWVNAMKFIPKHRKL